MKAHESIERTRVENTSVAFISRLLRRVCPSCFFVLSCWFFTPSSFSFICSFYFFCFFLSRILVFFVYKIFFAFYFYFLLFLRVILSSQVFRLLLLNVRHAFMFPCLQNLFQFSRSECFRRLAGD